MKKLYTLIEYVTLMRTANLLPVICTNLPTTLTEIKSEGLDIYRDQIALALDRHGISYPDAFRNAKLYIRDNYIYCEFSENGTTKDCPLSRFLASAILGLDIPAGYVVHHDDGSFNNNFHALMLIPSWLHRAYHRFLYDPARHVKNIPTGKEYDHFRIDLFARKSYRYLKAKYNVSTGYIWRERCRAGLINQ